MKEYSTEKIRNIVLLGHGGTGKTSFAEAALFISGAISRLGKVEDGTTASDFEPDEVKRKVSINASLLPVEWKDRKINLIDSPGYADFIGDAYSGLAAADTAVIVVCAASGVQVGTELAWEMADEAGKPRAILINRLDRENANFETTLSQINAQLSRRAVAVQLPIGNQHSFSGVVDLIDGKAYSGEKATAGDAPADMASAIEAARGALLEAAAENDEELLNKYLEEGDLSPEEIRKGIAEGVAAGDLVPVFAASSTEMSGVARFLDGVAEYFPAPGDVTVKAADGSVVKADASGPLAAGVFRTTADPYVGKLTYVRVYSGVLKADSHVWNSNRNHDERIGQVFVVRGKNHEAAPQLVAGDIGAVPKLGETATGDTLTTKEKPIKLAPIDFPE